MYKRCVTFGSPRPGTTLGNPGRGTSRLFDAGNNGFVDDFGYVFEISTASSVISADADISGSQSASLLRHSGRRAGIQSLYRVTPVRLPCV